MALRDSALNIIIRAKDLTGGALRALRDNLRGADDAADSAGAKLARMAKAAIGLASAAVGVTALARATQGMLATGDQMERLQVTMTALMGSIADGERATAWIKEFAAATPHQVTEVTDAFIALKGFGLDPMDGSLQAIVDQNAKLGKGTENLTGITLALGQAWAKQRLQGEEIMQLVERGVPVWELLGQATGRTTVELQAMSEAGTLGRDAISGLIKAMGAGAVGAAGANMTLLSGYVSNLKDEWAGFQTAVADAGALDFAKATLAGLLQTIQAMKADGSLAALAKQWSDGFVATGRTIAATAKTLAGLGDEFALLARAWVALKVHEWAGVFVRAAGGLGILAAGAAGAAARMVALSRVMAATAWIAAAEALYRVASGIHAVRVASEASERAEATLAATYARVNAAAVERGRALGLEVQNLRQWKEAIADGSVVLDEQTGKYRLNREAALQQGYAITAAAAAQDALKQSASGLSAPFNELRAAFDAARQEGDDLGAALEKMAVLATSKGTAGIQALALQLRLMEQQGIATRTELVDGLGAALSSLSAEDRGRFTQALTQGLQDVEAAGANTVVRLEHMQTLLEANLVAAGNAMGVSVSKALTGVDDATQTAVAQLAELSDAMQAAAVDGEGAGKIMAAGFAKVIETLDSREEIDAFTGELQRMAAEGDISTADLNTALEKVRVKTLEIAEAAGASGEALSGAMDAAGEAAEGAAQTGQAAAGIGAAMADIYQGVHAEIARLSASAVEAFENLQGLGKFTTDAPVGEVEQLRAAIDQSAESIRSMAAVAIGDFVGVSTWMKELRVNAETTKIAFYQQKVEFTRLMDAWADGKLTAEQFAAKAAVCERTMGLLDQQDLGQLRRGIGQAEQTMARLRDTSRSTLDTLRNELDSLQGNTERVERREYEVRKRDLEAALKDARASGDSDATRDAAEALRVAEQIHREKMGQISAEAAARKAAEAEQAQAAAASAAAPATATAPATPQVTPQATPQVTPQVTVELRLGTKRTTVTTDRPDALLDLLSDAGLRTA